MEFEETVEKYKFSITTHLKYIGLCVDELLSSQEAQANNRLFRYLTAILSATFKTLVSTSNLDFYLYKPTEKNSSATSYSDFKGYKTGVLIIISFTEKINKFNAFNVEKSEEEFVFSWLNELIILLNVEFKSIEKLYNRLNNDKELLK